MRNAQSGLLRGVLRVVGWNALLLCAAAALIATAGEAWFRLTKPFMLSSYRAEFIPHIGRINTPNTEFRYTNQADFWTVSRVNSLGFLDREPPSPERAAASCHISVIGDSFVEARQVPIARKFHVRLEQLAAAALPRLEVTTSAFGISGTGQIQQLPLYDEYVRRLRPKLAVLVFYVNDFQDNSPILRMLYARRDPQCPLREFSAARLADGTMELRPPPLVACEPYGAHTPNPNLKIESNPWIIRAARRHSWFGKWLHVKFLARQRESRDRIRGLVWLEWISRHPDYSAYFEGWQPAEGLYSVPMFAREDLPPVFEDALDYTVFALEQFKQRADRDGAKLVILASHGIKIPSLAAGVEIPGTRIFERLSAMAAALDIPVIDQADYILRQGADPEDAQWHHDFHWSNDGHRWAAEALLEWLQENPQVCGGTATKRAGGAAHAGKQS